MVLFSPLRLANDILDNTDFSVGRGKNSLDFFSNPPKGRGSVLLLGFKTSGKETSSLAVEMCISSSFISSGCSA